MAAVDLWGYRSGPRRIRYFELANTAISGGLVKGDFLVKDGAGTPYVTQASAGDLPIGVSNSAVAAADVPSADGDMLIQGYTHPRAIFEYPPDSGTVAKTTETFTTMDIGGAQSINIDASADDIIYVWSVDAAKNSLRVSVNFLGSFVGVA